VKRPRHARIELHRASDLHRGMTVRGIPFLLADDIAVHAQTAIDQPAQSRSETPVRSSKVTADDGSDISMSHRIANLRSQGGRDLALNHYVCHDALSGLPDRHAVHRLLALLMAELGGDGYAVFSLGLNGFNTVNDGLGHEIGDRLLLAIATRLQDVLGDAALVARHRGDEFIVVAAADRRRAVTLAKCLVRVFDAPFFLNGQTVFSSTSIGVVLNESGYDSPKDMLRDASIAMGRAKRLGRSRFVVFDKAMHEAARLRFMLGNDLRHALERREFRAHYQPIVDLASGRIVGCEALARWQHCDRGLLLPGEFLAVAEETGVICALDWWMLDETCRRLHEWQLRFGLRDGFVAHVNVDERQIKDAQFVPGVDATICANRIEPRSVALEVTETIFRSDRDELQETLIGLKRVGTSLVVDDFGTGYSSLESLVASPFDTLKLDRSFVQDLENNPRHRSIVRSISGLARDLELGLIAEGVESPAQAKLLIDVGCTMAQGFLYSRAVSQEGMEALLQEQQSRSD